MYVCMYGKVCKLGSKYACMYVCMYVSMYGKVCKLGSKYVYVYVW